MDIYTQICRFSELLYFTPTTQKYIVSTQKYNYAKRDILFVNFQPSNNAQIVY